MLILKRKSAQLDLLPRAVLRPDKLELLPPRKSKTPFNKDVNPKTQALMDKLRNLGFEPYISPQTGWILAPTNLVGINICINPEKQDFKVQLRNPLGTQVGPKTALCSKPEDLKKYVVNAGIHPVNSAEKDKDKTVNLYVNNNTHVDAPSALAGSVPMAKAEELSGKKPKSKGLWGLLEKIGRR
jgi:hypothetical protein